MNRTRYTTDEEKEYLSKAIAMIQSNTLSLRKGAEWLEHKTGKSISYEGLRKIMRKSSEESSNEEETGTLGRVS